MSLIAIRPLLALIFAISAATAHAAQECGFLSPSKIDQAFAEFAPWHTEVGGAVGHCIFLSDENAPPNVLSFIQQFKTSKTDADHVYSAIQKGIASSYVIAGVADFGDRAFRYSPKDNKSTDQRMTSIVVQKGKLVVTVTLNLQRELTDADISAVVKLGQFALRGSNDPEMAHKVSTCSWFDASDLKKLFGGNPHEVQVHGENSCMAADKQQHVLLVSAIEMSDGLSLDRLPVSQPVGDRQRCDTVICLQGW